jgi:predicted SAM-dependent methyltransferase
VYDAPLLQDVLRSAGFEVDVLEWCDEQGRFHFRYWDPSEGPIYRSLRCDHRNRGGRLGFASLIVEARKPSPAPGRRGGASVPDA